MVEGVQQGPVLVGTFFMVAEDYLPPTATPGTWALMSPAQGRSRNIPCDMAVTSAPQAMPPQHLWDPKQRVHISR